MSTASLSWFISLSLSKISFSFIVSWKKHIFDLSKLQSTNKDPHIFNSRTYEFLNWPLDSQSLAVGMKAWAMQSGLTTFPPG